MYEKGTWINFGVPLKYISIYKWIICLFCVQPGYKYIITVITDRIILRVKKVLLKITVGTGSRYYFVKRNYLKELRFY